MYVTVIVLALLGGSFQFRRAPDEPRVMALLAELAVPGHRSSRDLEVAAFIVQAPDLVWLDRKGAATPMTITPRLFQSMRFSPDGRRVVFEVGDSEGLRIEIWSYELERQSWTLIASERAINPVWSPDGQRIIYSSNANGPYNLFAVPADSSAAPRQITRRENWPLATSGSPDGRYVAVGEQSTGTGWDIRIIEVATGRATSFAVSPNSERGPVFSPDGHWIAYEEWEFGPGSGSRGSVVVARPFPGPGPKRQVSTADGGKHPVWIGNEILYLSGGAIYAVDVKTMPDLKLGKPHRLFEADLESYGYDVTPDGKRFLALRQKNEIRFDHLNLVRGWWLEGGS